MEKKPLTKSNKVYYEVEADSPCNSCTLSTIDENEYLITIRKLTTPEYKDQSISSNFDSILEIKDKETKIIYIHIRNYPSVFLCKFKTPAGIICDRYRNFFCCPSQIPHTSLKEISQKEAILKML